MAYSNKKSYHRRLLLVSLFFLSIAGVLAARFFVLQIKDSAIYTVKAQESQSVVKTLEAERGMIYFQDKSQERIPVAINKKYFNIFVSSKEIEDPINTAKILSPLLDIPENELVDKFNQRNSQYQILVKKISDKSFVDKILSLKLKGIHEESYTLRYYPLGETASQVIGFVAQTQDQKTTGRYGLEKYYDEVLAGKSGKFEGVKDRVGRLIRSVFSIEEPILPGASLITTIDKNIQFKAEEELKKSLEKWGANTGSVIIMEPKTGRILALANQPNFDLNNYNAVEDYSLFKNNAVEGRFELGSVLKVITMAIGLENKDLTSETKFYDSGSVVVDGHTITNFAKKSYGDVDMNIILEKSINTGIVYAQKLIGNVAYREYLKKFKFHEKTGIDLPNEISGDIKQLFLEKRDERQIYFSNASFGQGISMSPMSLTRAYATIANGGKLVTPFIVEKTMDDKGNISPANQTEAEQIISLETAKTLTEMMVKVVDNGYSKSAGIKGYQIAGKSGTANVADNQGYSEKTIQSFMGFFPASDPKFLIMVKLDDPKAASSSDTATYVFHDLAFYLINYYNLSPDNLKN